MVNEAEKIITLAKECVALSKEERPELAWLKGIYKRFQDNCGIWEKQAADCLTYEKMYSCAPARPSDTLKIRYWRTGRHVPVSRDQCLMLGKALEMNREEMEFLIKSYYDKNDQSFEGREDYPVYQKRKELLEDMVMEYLKKIHPGRRRQMRIAKRSLENNVRHLYYMEAMKYVNIRPQQIDLYMDSHITSINYGSELNRSLRLEGEIPRKTMLRHFFIFGMPYVSKELMDERLEAFGYLPLREDHTMTDGGRLDWLVIRLLELYEDICRGQEPEKCSEWFQDACRMLDGYFEEEGQTNLRFMYFKALKE